MRILGIDPALGTLGWGVVDYSLPSIKYVNSGLIKTKPALPLFERLGDIANQIRQIIVEYKPETVGMEITFLNKNATSSFKLAYVRGVIMSIVGELNLQYKEYSPNQIKKALVGAGHAEKEQVKYMVKMLMPTVSDKINLDEADALAVAYCCTVL